MESRRHTVDYRHTVALLQVSELEFNLTYQAPNEISPYPTHIDQEPCLEVSLSSSKKTREDEITKWLNQFHLPNRYINELIASIEECIA